MLEINLDVICFLEIILELIKSSYKSIYVEAISWTIINPSTPMAQEYTQQQYGRGRGERGETMMQEDKWSSSAPWALDSNRPIGSVPSFFRKFGFHKIEINRFFSDVGTDEF